MEAVKVEWSTAVDMWYATGGALEGHVRVLIFQLPVYADLCQNLDLNQDSDPLTSYLLSEG